MIITRDVAKWNDASTLKPLYHNGRRVSAGHPSLDHPVKSVGERKLAQ